MKKVISILVFSLAGTITSQAVFLHGLQGMQKQKIINEMILRLTKMKDGGDASFATSTDIGLAAQREVLDYVMEEDTASYNYTKLELGKAINLYNKGDYQTALPIFTKFTDDGVSEARYYLARCYYYGQGTERNYSKAVDLFEQNNGVLLTDAYSYFLLSRCFRYGKGTTTDHKKADSLVIEAACRGLNEAIELLQIEKEMSRNDILDWLISILNDKMEYIRKRNESIEKELKDAVNDSVPKFGLG